MLHIAAFFGTAAVHKVYCGVFWDHNYRYNLLRCPTVVGHKTAAINISFSADTIAAVEKKRRNMRVVVAFV